MNEYPSNTWNCGEWEFQEFTKHPFKNYEKPLYGFVLIADRENAYANGKKSPLSSELYWSLEHAMAAAIAEKYQGKRGAGGTAVDTADGWFMRMIGAEPV